MAKSEKDEVDKISKKIIIWLIIISLSVFFFPFIGTLINHCIGLNIGELYTFGIADRKDFFTVWIALFGAIGIAINIYQNHRRTTNQDMQLIKQTEQIELQSKSQRDSRFSKGVELLGNANESARTGASYSLYFLAKDYPEEFAKPVFEVLCSHVRSITTTEEYKRNNYKHPSNEIQSIIDLLFRNTEYSKLFHGLKADLKYSYLIGANLLGANLSEANLSKADLSGANLSGVNLSKADLSEVDLLEVSLYRANLSGVNLSEANLSKANLSGANLSGANLSGANLSGANLSGAALLGTDLSRADLAGNKFTADLFPANLSGAYLFEVKIENTKFSEKTILDGVDISQIDTTKIRGKINPNYLTTPGNETNADSQ